MRLSQIKSVLESRGQVGNFKKEIEVEVSEYKKQLRKKGASSPIILNEDISYNLTKEHMDSYLYLVNLNLLDRYEASYIADALLLSEKIFFEDDDMNDQLEHYVINEANF